MVCIKEFNTVFVKVNNSADFDDNLKLVFRDDVYISAKDFFAMKYGIEITAADVILGDTTYLILQFDDSIWINDLYAISSNGTISLNPKIDEDNYIEALTFKFAI